jgi:hypothetical protein
MIRFFATALTVPLTENCVYAVVGAKAAETAVTTRFVLLKKFPAV